MPHRKNTEVIILTVTPGKKISAIQQEFTSAFPYLKLEFFKKKHGVHEQSAKKDIIRHDTALTPVKNVDKKAIAVTENMSVAALEQMFQEQFGLSAQVFRKSGRSWLETSLTDDWSLKKQNDQGFELSLFAS